MDSSDADIDAFMQWFQSSGGKVDTRVMGITGFPGSGRGAIALCDIPEGHSLFTLPRTVTLSTQTSSLPALFGLDAWRARGLHKGWAGLILCLMWEDGWAHESDVMDVDGQDQIRVHAKWGPYMRTLPATFDTPMFWNAEELRELQGTSVIDKIGRDDAERAYTEQLVPAIQTSPTLFPPSHHAKWYTLDAYHRAGSRILSRSFTVSPWTDNEQVGKDADRDGEAWTSGVDLYSYPRTSAGSPMQADAANPPHEMPEVTEEWPDSDLEDDDPFDVTMVPMADLLNAKWGCENAKLFYEPLILRMATTRNIDQGKQIFNTYGDLPNSDLLRRYGHVDLVRLHSPSTRTLHGDTEMKEGDTSEEAIMHLGNPSDVVEIRADLVAHIVKTTNCSVVEDVGARTEWWLDEGEDDTFVLTPPESRSRSSAILPPALVSFTRLLTLSEADFEKARVKGKLPTGKLQDGGDGNKKVLEMLDEVFKQREEMYFGGSIEDDERLSLSEAFTERKRHAVIVRLGEKRIIRAIRQKLRTVHAELLTTSGTISGNVKDDARRVSGGGSSWKESSGHKKRAVDGAERDRGSQKKARSS